MRKSEYHAAEMRQWNKNIVAEKLSRAGTVTSTAQSALPQPHTGWVWIASSICPVKNFYVASGITPHSLSPSRHGYVWISLYGDHPPTAFSIQILGKIIKKFSEFSVFPIYIIVILNLDLLPSQRIPELLYFFDSILRTPNLWLKYFLTNKTKTKNKIEKYEDFSCRLGKLASSLKINITKMGKNINLINLR